jgi:acyl-CoA synthetase (AMP-forming)/AMP-acid ligase II
MVIGDILTINASNFPGKMALIIEGERYTYQQMNMESNRIANALIRKGVGEGQRVAILEKTSARTIQTLFGVAKSGATLVMINNLLKPRELQFILNDCEPTILFIGVDYIDAIASIRDKVPFIQELVSLGEGKKGAVPFSEWVKESLPVNPEKKVSEESIFDMIYTAGTTGIPKAAIYTHHNFWENLLCSVIDTGQGYDEIWLGPVPLFHIGGFGTLMRAFLMSNTLILYESFDAQTYLQTIEKERVTILYAYPTMIHALVNHPNVKQYDYSTLRLVIYGGSAMSLSLLEKAFDIFGCDFLQRYGGTECCGIAISVLSPQDHRCAFKGGEKERRRLSSVGRPSLGTLIKIVDDEGREVTQPGTIGEIFARLNTPMEGYWKRPEDSKEVFREGWLTLGDVGMLDEDGYLYIVDRKKDMIISGARNIYSREIEEVLLTHPSILEAAVIGVSDDYWGESVKALVVLHNGMKATEEEIIAFCKSNMASYKRPRYVEFVDSLPKNPGGKIDKKEVRRRYGSPSLRGLN